MYCKIVFDQEVKNFIRCHEDAFRYFGGVPKTVKIDNLKAAILEATFTNQSIKNSMKSLLNTMTSYQFLVECIHLLIKPR